MAQFSAEPPFVRIGPDRPESPVVLSVPHAGRAYSPALLASSRLALTQLETLEDPLVDGLIGRATADGASALVARAPRVEIDLNRDEREIDAAMVAPPPPARLLLQSPRTRGGLGLVPARIGGAGSIWLRRLPAAELARRIETIHRPYHQALAAMLAAARMRFGVAILLDCHSMPARGGDAPPGVVLGDRYGTSIGPDYVAAALAALAGAGARVERNAPYAGGYITTRHGRPGAGVHALQIELDRSLYLAADLRSPGAGFARTAELLATLVAALAAKALEPPSAIAAE